MDHHTQLPTSEVDVVIVGAGPAGLMSNLWLSAFKGVSVRIIDKRTATFYAGTQEVFNSFGFEERVLKIAQPMAEFSFWQPDRNGRIYRSSRTADGPPNMSRFQGAVLHQGYIERFLKDAIKEREGPDVEYGVQPDLHQVDEMIEGDDSHPITLRIRHLSEQESAPSQFGHTRANGLFRSTNFTTSKEEDQAINKIAKAGTQEMIKCKYLFGCDGAHSWIRRQIGVDMEGDQTDFIWGVLDIHPLTDFPDIRSRCSIHSARNGSLMVIPRENELVCLYIQLEDLERNMDGRIDSTKIAPEDILRAAQKIMSPYNLQYDYCDWFTAYQIGQRVSTRYTKFDLVFILGDACHTHSPKAGQGMNVSLMDAYNLGWKIAQVLQRKAPRSILATYEAERRPVAQELIEFDRKWSSLFSGKLEPDFNQAEDGLLKEFKQTFEDAKLFVAGITVTYAPSVLVDETSHQRNHHSSKVLSKTDLAKGIHLGMRIPSYRVLNQADARSCHLQDRLPSNGQLRLLIFAGSMIDLPQRERVLAFADYLLSPLSILNTYTSEYMPLFGIIAVHSGPRTEVELSHFPAPLRKSSEYNNEFVDDHSYLEPFGDAYKNYGVDSIRGYVVLIRPDQYVSWIGDFEDTDKLETFCQGCLRRWPSSPSL
ncbi:uncharacterized protein Z519_11776 [Cladophialophora bantiana CBS 173.52]|uniref:Phenol 2-monooxygenase n=1 Tax=Cladophialophora bantiana (strain ATCC 10958 / CBS 173.52 / CDC B-1940 / NIH 8579) TaxID=1442370 RepID=A0A0D2FM56_CLAB1|nr:uncharacterized protein Z519_11776 [Cladophialophora bantiana CBS 173.52]KIW87802.1 hypothetical protein Z519_11776 [Cladophialophora bantiana CBS 173.52]